MKRLLVGEQGRQPQMVQLRVTVLIPTKSSMMNKLKKLQGCKLYDYYAGGKAGPSVADNEVLVYPILD